MWRRDGSAAVRRWILVVVAAILGVGVAAFTTAARTSHYRASTWLFFSVSGASTIGDLTQGATYTENLVPAFVAVATTQAVLDPVNQQLGLHLPDSKLAAMVHPKAVIGRSSCTSRQTGRRRAGRGDRQRRRRAVVEDCRAALASRYAVRCEADVGNRGRTCTATTLTARGRRKEDTLRRRPSRGPTSWHLPRAVTRGPRALVRDERGISKVSDAPVLGRIEYARRKPLLLGDTEGHAGEAFRALRANVFALRPSRPRAIVITASSHGEGATTTAINLALVAAETGLRVLLVEADLRHPSTARAVGLPDVAGLAQLVAGGGTLAATVRDVAWTRGRHAGRRWFAGQFLAKLSAHARWRNWWRRCLPTTTSSYRRPRLTHLD